MANSAKIDTLKIECKRLERWLCILGKAPHPFTETEKKLHDEMDLDLRAKQFEMQLLSNRDKRAEKLHLQAKQVEMQRLSNRNDRAERLSSGERGSPTGAVPP